MMSNEPVEGAGSRIDRQWWEALKEGKLLYQGCQDCDSPIFYPREVCPHCLSSRLEWQISSGKGTVYSLTTVHRAPPAPGLKAPYVVALVDLAEGFRMLAPITDARTEKMAVGSTVEFCTVVVPDDDTHYPRFRLKE